LKEKAGPGKGNCPRANKTKKGGQTLEYAQAEQGGTRKKKCKKSLRRLEKQRIGTPKADKEQGGGKRLKKKQQRRRKE